MHAQHDAMMMYPFRFCGINELELILYISTSEMESLKIYFQTQGLRYGDKANDAKTQRQIVITLFL